MSNAWRAVILAVVVILAACICSFNDRVKGNSACHTCACGVVFILAPVIKRGNMCEQFEGIGITRDELRVGTIVMVAVGRISAVVNSQSCVIAPAEVMGSADPAGETWWLDVLTAPGVYLPQMYRADEILGLPAPSLTIPREDRRADLP